MDGVESIAISPDGSAAYVAARESAAVDSFERHADGSLTQLPGTAGCITETGREDPSLDWTAGYCGDGRALLGSTRVVIDGGGAHIYTAAQNGGIGVFDVVEPPTPDQLATPVYTAQPSIVATSDPDRACRLLRAKISRLGRRLRVTDRAIEYLAHLSEITHRQQRRLRKERRARHSLAKSLRLAKKKERRQCAAS
jgi:hypothetical protein